MQTDGRLLPERLIPIPGRAPRDFRLLGPEEMLVACQDEGGLLWLRDGREAGRLDIPGAVCVSKNIGD